MPFEIHISDLKTCRAWLWQWDWASPLRQKLEPDRPYLPFFLGRILHETFDAHYGAGLVWSEAFQEAVNRNIAEIQAKDSVEWEVMKDEYLEQVQLASAMVLNYHRWTELGLHKRQWWHDDNLQFVATEHEFRAPIPTRSGRASPRVFLAGRYDGVVRRLDDGTLWLWELKTSTSFSMLERSLAIDPQPTAYIYAAEHDLGEPVAGVLYTLIRKKAPTDPVTPTGKLSQAKNMDTSLEHWVARMRQLHPEANNGALTEMYGGHLQYLIANRSDTFVKRFAIRRNQAEMDLFLKHLHSTALDMANPVTPLYPNEGFHCNRCMFWEPCLSRRQGYDYRALINAPYTDRDVWYEREDVADASTTWS